MPKDGVFWVVVSLLASLALTEDRLAKEFLNPPDYAKPHTWWHWINDNITKEGIRADLEAMKEIGIGGAQIFNVDVGVPLGDVKFMSDKWREMIGHAIKEAERLGLEICVHNGPGWSSSGGPWVRPEHAMQFVITSQIEVKGPAHFSGAIPRPHKPDNPGAWGFSGDIQSDFYRDIAVLAFPKPKEGLKIENLQGKAGYIRTDNLQPLLPSAGFSPDSLINPQKIVDLTGRMQADGHLEWDVPEGEWVILRLGYTPTGKASHPTVPEARGFECDKFSREAVQAFWEEGMLKAIMEEAGPLTGKVWNNVLIDSYEVGNQNWTPRMSEEFQKRRGYSIYPFLPVLAGYVVGSPEISERFLWDFRRTLAELFAENYSGYFAELCHKHGMKLSIEPYGNGPFEDITYGGRADIPMGEFWVEGWATETCKLAGSIGHVYGHRIIGAESFTAGEGRWQSHPYAIKTLGDRVYTLGVNRFIFHRYAHQPWLNWKPGMTMGPFGFNFDRTNTWWEMGKAWIKYLTRCQYLLQQGVFVGDVLFFVGEHAPNSALWRPDLKAKGYDYDSCNAEVLLTRIKVQNGYLTLPDGTRYRLLVLPDSEFMTPEVAGKVRDLVKAGAIVIGPKPRKSPSLTNYPKCDEEVRRIADDVWGNCDGKTVKEHTYGKGKVIWGKALEDVLKELNLPPDFESTDPHITFIHRRDGDVDIYFLSNQSYFSREVSCTFRVKGKVPELWHPDTGRMEKAVVYQEKGGRITLPIRFDPAGSVFVVFREKAKEKDHLVALQAKPIGEEKRVPKLEIKRAVYEAVDGAGGADVTEILRSYIKEGRIFINVNNTTMGGDPTPLHYKRLVVEYTLDGKSYTIVVPENEDLQIPSLEVGGFPTWEAARKDGKVELIAFVPGTYEYTKADGKKGKVQVSSLPGPVEIGGPWEVYFPPNWGAPERIVLERLISWTEHEDFGVRHFSGTATYRKEFDVPKEMLQPKYRLYLDLGDVQIMAQVKLNGRDLGIFWKPPFRLDITDVVRPGRNQLEVKVTNLWINRLIGDEHFPDDCEWDGPRLKEFPKWFLEGRPRPVKERLTFATWKFYSKNSPLVPSGLIGPVVLRVAERIPLAK